MKEATPEDFPNGALAAFQSNDLALGKFLDNLTQPTADTPYSDTLASSLPPPPYLEIENLRGNTASNGAGNTPHQGHQSEVGGNGTLSKSRNEWSIDIEANRATIGPQHASMSFSFYFPLDGCMGLLRGCADLLRIPIHIVDFLLPVDCPGTRRINKLLKLVPVLILAAILIIWLFAAGRNPS